MGLCAPVDFWKGLLSGDRTCTVPVRFVCPAISQRLTRTAGVFNSKAVAWANAARAIEQAYLVPATYTNATAAKAADAAVSEAALQ